MKDEDLGIEEEVVETELDDAEETEDEDVIEEELDEEGNPITVEVESWMADEDDQTDSKVPVSTHIKMKQKLKGRLKDQDGELEKLRAENEALKAQSTVTKPDPNKLPTLPKESEFDDDAKYEEALNVYHKEMATHHYSHAQRQTSLQQNHELEKKRLEDAVEAHYDRATKLVETYGISPEVFQQADRSLREAAESVMPGRGDLLIDDVIATMGEGSEKVLFSTGRNQKSRDKFIALLVEDKRGVKAAMFLAEEKARLLNTKTTKSKARPPASRIEGDVNASPKAGSLKKQYDGAIKKGDTQSAFNLKRQAKGLKVDVSSW